jgi:formate/nitrite transporter FocA (FNT family)
MADQATEQHKADEREALSATAVHKALLQEGENELDRSSGALFWSALAAGISIGLSLIAQGVLRQHLPDSNWRPLLISLGYSFGFIAVTLGRQQLFTETTLTAMLPLLHHKRLDVLANVLRLWVVVFAANMLGTFLFAWAGAWTSTFSPELSRTMADIGVEKVGYTFGTAFVKGIFGGWLIALMVWLMPSAHEARIWVIALVTWLLATAQLTHIIAGSTDVMFAVLSGRVEWITFLTRFAAPVFLGNSIGGIVFVAALNHAQVAHGERGPANERPLVINPQRGTAAP